MRRNAHHWYIGIILHHTHPANTLRSVDSTDAMLVELGSDIEGLGIKNPAILNPAILNPI